MKVGEERYWQRPCVWRGGPFVVGERGKKLARSRFACAGGSIYIYFIIYNGQFSSACCQTATPLLITVLYIYRVYVAERRLAG